MVKLNKEGKMRISIKVVLLLVFFSTLSWSAPSFLSGVDSATTYADTFGKSTIGVAGKWFLGAILPAFFIVGMPMLVAKFGKKHIMQGNDDEKWKMVMAYLGAIALGIILTMFALFFVGEGLFADGDKGLKVFTDFWKGIFGV